MELDVLTRSVDDFLRHLADERRSAPNTLAAYHNDLSQFIKFLTDHESVTGAMEPTSAESIGSEVLTSFVFALRERGYAPSTIARRIAAVKSFFSYAQSVGHLSANPAAALNSPRVTRTARVAVSAREIQVLLDVGCSGRSPDDIRNRAMFTLLYRTGLRVSEVVGLDVEDIDLGKATLRSRGRTGRTRSLPLPPQAGEAVEAYLAEARPALARGENQRALFLNGRGGRLTRQGFWLIITTRARRSGVRSPMSPHALRNSFVRERLEEGTALSDLKEMLGHLSISTTRAYARSNGAPGRAQRPNG
ncbi:MAG: tyrosine-type recombinase/integrase [Chloroflexi bacterium]|nr:tyrosine-type recombinase/integrase [Chloroflexota bacterium]